MLNGGFADGTYGYVIPASRGKVARFTLSDFNAVEVLDLKATDSDLSGSFFGGFTDGAHGYLCPSYSARGKVPRFQVAPSLATTGNTDAGAATGDPHLQNIHGERFDLMKPGTVTLIHIPRGVPVQDSMLTVVADAVRLGESCADLYFQMVNIT